MQHAIDRRGGAAALALAAIVATAAYGATALAAADGGRVQLAQAGSAKRTAPPANAPRAQPSAPSSPTADMERQITDIQKQLKITPAQQPQFDAFAQAMRQNAQAMEAVMQQEPQNASRNAVDELRSATKVTEAQAEGLKRMLPPFQALYESLSDQQKRLADQIFGQGPQGGEPAPPARPHG